jgi:hypothetical protein
MAQEVIPVSSSRALIRVPCANSPGAQGGVLTISPAAPPTGGIVNVTGHLYPAASGGAGGVPAGIKIVPGAGSSETYTLSVYGAVPTLGLPGTVGPFLWLPLFSGSVAATLAYTGDQVSGALTTADYLLAAHSAAVAAIPVVLNGPAPQD